MQSQREYVMRTVEERAVRFIQLWFTDVLGIPKSFSITPAEFENALDEGMTFDGSSIDGFSRVAGKRRPRQARPEDLPDPPVSHRQGRRRLPGRPGLLRHHQPRRLAVRGLSPPCAAPDARACPGPGFTFYAAPGDRVLLLRPSEPGATSRTARLGVVLRAHRC